MHHSLIPSESKSDSLLMPAPTPYIHHYSDFAPRKPMSYSESSKGKASRKDTFKKSFCKMFASVIALAKRSDDSESKLYVFDV